jgi:hypothetical protein
LPNCPSEARIRKQLADLPTNIYDTYTQVISRIPKTFWDDAKLFLMWLAFSFRPLTAEEVQQIPGINLEFNIGESNSPFNYEAVYCSQEMILKACASFVVCHEGEE